MKKSVFLIIGILFIAVYSAQAQSPVVFKYKNNPMYSIHNYKHPDKAALARKYNLTPVVTLDYIQAAPAADNARRNYKVQAAPAQPQVLGGVVPVIPQKKQANSVHSPANYKRQFK